MSSISLTLDELRSYNEEERRKWNEWFRRNDSSVFDLPMQSTAMFSTVWRLIDHIFVVERRHLQRLRSEYPLPETTGVAHSDWDGIWQFGSDTRRELVSLISGLADADVPRPLPIMGSTRMITPRKLLFHIFFHEARHWAQISLALRNAGLEPPPDQDLVFSSAMQ